MSLTVHLVRWQRLVRRVNLAMLARQAWRRRSIQFPFRKQAIRESLALGKGCDFCCHVLHGLLDASDPLLELELAILLLERRLPVWPR